MITAVTLNPAIDRTVIVETYCPGSVNRVVTSREDIGGKGINVTRILLALGSEAVAVGFVGARNEAHVRDLLARDGIKGDFVSVDAFTRQNIKLIENKTHQTTDINEAGFQVNSDDIEAMKKLISHYAASSSFVVFSGSVPPGMANTIYHDLAALLPSDCKLAIDADGALLLNGLAARPYLIKPNIHELENALGSVLTTAEDIKSASRQIIEKYQVSYVLVSMGGDGSILVTANTAMHAAALKVNVRNTVGAGDTMLAGFIHSLAIGRSDRQALAYATACGALAVSKAGTETIGPQEVDNLVNQVQINELP